MITKSKQKISLFFTAIFISLFTFANASISVMDFYFDYYSSPWSWGLQKSGSSLNNQDINYALLEKTNSWFPFTGDRISMMVCTQDIDDMSPDAFINTITAGTLGPVSSPLWADDCSFKVLQEGKITTRGKEVKMIFGQLTLPTKETVSTLTFVFSYEMTEWFNILHKGATITFSCPTPIFADHVEDFKETFNSMKIVK